MAGGELVVEVGAGAGSEASERGFKLPNFDLAGLSDLEPETLVRGRDDELGIFFLMLALAYNDLKGLAWTQHTLLDAIRGRSADEVSPEVGQVNGILTQTVRYSVGHLREILDLIAGRRALLESSEFLALPFTDVSRERWRRLEGLALQKAKAEPFVAALIAARSNVAFHYNQTDVLAQAYAEHFTPGAEEPKRSRAYVSIGRTMEASRFYYADAAALQALGLSAQKVRFAGDFLSRVSQELDQLNETVMGALAAFLLSRGAQLRPLPPEEPTRAASSRRPRPVIKDKAAPSREVREKKRATRRRRR